MAAAANETCPNAIVAASTELQNVLWQFVEVTADNSVCPRLNGQPSCCPANVISAAEVAYGVARQRVILAQERVKQVQDNADELKGEFDKIRSNVEDAFNEGKISETQRDALLQLVDDMENAILEFLDVGELCLVL